MKKFTLESAFPVRVPPPRGKSPDNKDPATPCSLSEGYPDGYAPGYASGYNGDDEEPWPDPQSDPPAALPA